MTSAIDPSGENQTASRREKPASLRVLPDTTPYTRLREGGRFNEPLEWTKDKDDKTPRALRGLAKIIDGGLCHRCGSCVGICPTGVLGLDSEDYPAVHNLSACTDCDLCVKVCPGDEFDLHEAYKKTLGVEADVTSTHGHFIDSFISYSTDPMIRERSTSGGLVLSLIHI